MKWLAGAAPEISNTHTNSSTPDSATASPHRTSCSVVDGSSPRCVHTRLVTSASMPAHSSTSLKWGSARPSKSTPAIAAANRRPLGVVQQPLGEVRRDAEVLQALLILDADRRAAEGVGQAHRGVVHRQAFEHLPLGELGGLVVSEPKGHAALEQPGEVRARLRVAHLAHGGVQRRLTQALLEESQRVQQVIGDDGVVHPHAAFVEDAEEGLVGLEREAEPVAGVDGRGERRRPRFAIEGPYVRAVVIDVAALAPLAPAPAGRSRR